MRDFFVISLSYPDSGPALFLLCMLGVISMAIWVGVKEK